MDVLLLCHKIAYEPRMVVEGQGHFTQDLQLRITQPVV